MIPKSRRISAGAYRNVEPNFINGELETVQFGSGVSNDLKTRLSSVVISDSGSYNKVTLYKRKVTTRESGRTYVANVNLSMGSANIATIKMWHPMENDFSLNISIGTKNAVDVKLIDTDDFSIGDDNTIIGEFDTASNGVSVGNNNILIDFKPEIKKGTEIVGFARKAEMLYETKVIEYAGVGQNYITIEDTSKVMFGTEIIFGSVAAAFVRRVVTSVSGNNVYFEEPLSAREATFVDANVFNEYYEILPEFRSTLSRDAEMGTKRIFLSESAPLHLRDVTIGGSFKTKVFFVREADNMAIIKDLTPDDIPLGSEIFSPAVNKYSSWALSGEIDADNQRRFNFSGDNKAFIGRTTEIDGVTLSVVGFDSGSITFDGDMPPGTQNVFFGELDSSRYGIMTSSLISYDTPANETIVPVDDTSGFFIGQTIRIDGKNRRPRIIEKTDSTITIDEAFIDNEINNSFFVGNYQLSSNSSESMQILQDAKNGLHEYIFGEE